LETLVVQEFLDGGAKNLYSCGVIAAGGEIIVSMQANRIRQNPMDFGNSTTYAISCFVPQILEQTEALLRMTNYSGVGEVEWMWDAKAQQYKFLEINTRAWKWHTISNQLGFSFIGALIDWFDGVSQKCPTMDQKDKVAWVERLTDWTVIAKEILHGRMTLEEVCASYKIKHESAVWSWRDPLPAIMYILLSPILYVKRH
jgi:predicted ATP-grasp superfamily ATP-dependent carboligase